VKRAVQVVGALDIVVVLLLAGLTIGKQSATPGRYVPVAIGTAGVSAPAATAPVSSSSKSGTAGPPIATTTTGPAAAPTTTTSGTSAGASAQLRHRHGGHRGGGPRG
jgi:hypothetical protein